jgi:hypothetical protein
VWKRQTVADLVATYGRSKNWIRKTLDTVAIRKKNQTKPQPTVGVFDGTHITGEVLLVGRSPTLKCNLGWVWVPAETKEAYAGLRAFIEEKGYTLTAVVLDGRTGIPKVFSDIPVQICQFHQLQIVKRKLTLKPETEAGQTLLSLTFSLAHTTEAVFTRALEVWYTRYESFIQEKTHILGTRRWHYTHCRVRSAYLSLKRNLPFLFTYQKYPHLNLPNTTNCLDGYWSRVKNLLSAHRGKTKERIKKLVNEILRK